jgi:hypothetical protein
VTTLLGIADSKGGLKLCWFDWPGTPVLKHQPIDMDRFSAWNPPGEQQRRKRIMTMVMKSLKFARLSTYAGKCETNIDLLSTLPQHQRMQLHFIKIVRATELSSLLT